MISSALTSLPLASLTFLYLIRDFVSLSKETKERLLSSVALYRFTGIFTNPNPIEPFHSERIMPWFNYNQNNLRSCQVEPNYFLCTTCSHLYPPIQMKN